MHGRPSPTPTAAPSPRPGRSPSGSDEPVAGAGTFPRGTSCTLAQVGATSSSCSVTYTPGGQRRHAQDRGRLRGALGHDKSDGSDSTDRHQALDRDRDRAAPARSPCRRGFPCTATVSDTDGGRPSPADGLGHLQARPARWQVRPGPSRRHELHAGAGGPRPAPAARSAYTPAANAGSAQDRGRLRGARPRTRATAAFDLTVTKRTTATAVAQPGLGRPERRGFHVHGDRLRHRRQAPSPSPRGRSPSGSTRTRATGTFTPGHELHAGAGGRDQHSSCSVSVHAHGQRRHAQGRGRLLGLGHAQDQRRQLRPDRDQALDRDRGQLQPRLGRPTTKGFHVHGDRLRHRRRATKSFPVRVGHLQAPTEPGPSTFTPRHELHAGAGGRDQHLQLLGQRTRPRPTPAAHKVAGAYSDRSATHKSDGSFDLTVTKRSTATAVISAPARSPSTKGFHVHGDRLRHRRRHQVLPDGVGQLQAPTTRAPAHGHLPRRHELHAAPQVGPTAPAARSRTRPRPTPERTRSRAPTSQARATHKIRTATST